MVNMFVWFFQKRKEIVKMNEGKTPVHFRKQDVHGTLKRVWDVFQSKWHSRKAEKTMVIGNAVLSRWYREVFTCTYTVFKSSSENIVA